MRKNVQPYNNSLYFNQFDLRVIVSGSFNREKFLVAKLQNSFEGGNVPPGLTVLEILPLYSIGRENGIFTKKHLQNYNNVHGLLISQTLAKEIRKRWKKCNKGHYVISFVKTKLFSRTIQQTKTTFYYMVTLLSGPCIMTSVDVTGIYFKPPQNFLVGETIKIENNMNQLKCQNIIEVDRLNWRTYNLMEPSVKQKFTVQANPKCTVSILNTKLSNISEQRQETPSTSTVSVATASSDINRNVTQQDRPEEKPKVEPVLPQKKVQKVKTFVSNVRSLPSVGRNPNRSVIGTAARFTPSSSNSVNDVFVPLVPPRRNVFSVRTPSRPPNMNLSSDNNTTTSTRNANKRDKTRAPTASNPVASNGKQSSTVRVSRCHPSNSNNDNNLHTDDFIGKLRRTRLLNFNRNCRIFYPKRNTQILFKRTNVLQPSTRANISVPTVPRAPGKISRGIGSVNKQARNNGSSRPLITDEFDFDLNLY